MPFCSTSLKWNEKNVQFFGTDVVFCRYRQENHQKGSEKGSFLPIPASFCEKLLPLGYPAFDFPNPLRILLHLSFDEVVAVFAVAEAVAARHVVVVFERAEDFLVVFQVLLVVGQKFSQILQIGFKRLASGIGKALFHVCCGNCGKDTGLFLCRL